MEKLLKHLIDVGVLKTPQLIEGFKAIDRVDFVLENMRDLAYVDEALPIGEGQTISQPYTVAFMLELLQPQADDKIMDIGFGSGWQTVLLAQITGRDGKIYAIEIVPELCEFGKQNISKYNENGIVETFCQSGENGLPDIAKKISGFDKIIAAAALGVPNTEFGVRNTTDSLPQAWKDQLKIGGRIVAPIGGSIWLFIKKSAAEFESREYPGFAFVPFV